MLNRKRQDRSNHDLSQDTSLIARGTSVSGDLRFSGALHLDGRIEGALIGDGPDAVFTLSEHGQVQGDIRVPNAIINGLVQGDIHVSGKLELAAQARVSGDVSYNMLEMTAGAKVNGRMSHYGSQTEFEPMAALELDHAVPA